MHLLLNTFKDRRLPPSILTALVTCVLAFLTGCLEQEETSARERVEKQIRANGNALLEMPYPVPTDVHAVGFGFDHQILAKAQFFAVEPDSDNFIYIDEHGSIHKGKHNTAKLEKDGLLLITREDKQLFVDGKRVGNSLKGWRIFWTAAKPKHPPLKLHKYPDVRIKDGFMREDINNNNAAVSNGVCQSFQHGGGIPEDVDKASSYNTRRAVNPFTVRSRDFGILTYGKDSNWTHYHAEARFYFGIPPGPNANVIDNNTVPSRSDMLMAQGAKSGPQVAFGWSGRENSFLMLFNENGKRWRVLKKWQQRQPPVTNWLRIGIEVRNGYQARGYLDGEVVLKADLPALVQGPFHIMAGKAEIEFDDVRAWSLPKSESEAEQLFVKSKQFAAKKRKNQRSDPEQFLEWARGEDAFTTRKNAIPGKPSRQALEIVTRLPLIGPFEYEPVSLKNSAGTPLVPLGVYRFSLYPVTKNGTPASTSAYPAIYAHHTKDGWAFRNKQGNELQLHGLRIGQGKHTDNRLALRWQGKWHPISQNTIDQPVFLGIAHIIDQDSPDANKSYPDAPHHIIRAKTLHNEFFENAPTEWNWTDGTFRMDCRWACQNQWNFMACGSPAVPFMVSKRRFMGDQVHQFYRSLRPVFPWDAGDKTFEYNPRKDSGWRFFKKHNGWYNRHDFNFSFCTDGRNPFSGYTIIFGADDNQETRLYRKDKLVATTRKKQFLFPTGRRHGVIHWKWWKFTIQNIDGRIRVYLNDELMFDYQDQAPLPGGHIALWTVRNGFTVSKYTGMAEETARDPFVLYEKPDSPYSPWQPLRWDTVSIEQKRVQGHHFTKVNNTSGTGFMAVRYTRDLPVDLRQTPTLQLPIHLMKGARVNLHLQINNQSFLVGVNAPLQGTKGLLTPEFEKGECFQLPILTAEQVTERYLLTQAPIRNGRIKINLLKHLPASIKKQPGIQLRSLTIGNSSNDGYLLGGRGGNTASAAYLVGTPTFSQ